MSLIFAIIVQMYNLIIDKIFTIEFLSNSFPLHNKFFIYIIIMRLHQLFHNVSLRELNLSSRLRKKMKKEIKFKIGEYMLKYRAKTKVNKSYKICK
jgi:hypothetical protein